MTFLEVPCIEVCKRDKLYGYVIFFSGGWDAYLLRGASLICVARNFTHSYGAVKAVRKGHDWRRKHD